MHFPLRRLSGLVLASCALVPTAAQAAENGPTPTKASLRASAGSYAITSTKYADSATPGFGAATVFSPKNPGATKFGVVAFAPGFTENSSAVSWLAQRVASHGFVTIAFNVNNTFTDYPASRGQQLLRALDFVTTTSKERTVADASRTAVSGHSMGGGGSMDAARSRPSLKAAVGLTPWNPNIRYDDVTVPSLQIGGQNDIIAPVSSNANVFYRSMPDSTPKGIVVIKGGGHFVTNSASAGVGAATVAWIKTFVDGDERYRPFICGAGTGLDQSKLSAFSNNC